MCFPSRKTFIVLFLLALSLRSINLAWLLSFNLDNTDGDSIQYWRSASLFLETSRYLDGVTVSDAIPLTERMPGYIFFIATCRWLFSHEFLSVFVSQIFIDSVTVLLIGILLRRFGCKCMIVAMVLAALSPNLIIHSALLLTDSLFLFFLAATLVSAERASSSHRLGWVVAAGFMLGMATLIRPVSYPLLFALAAGAGMAFWLQQRILLRAMIAAVLLLLSGSALLLPWQLRNLTMFDTAELTSQSGTHLQNWVAAEVAATENGTSRETEAVRLQREGERIIDDWGKNFVGLNPFESSALVRSVATRQLLDQPVDAILKTYLRGAVLFFSAPPVLFDPRTRALPKTSFDSTTGSLLDRAMTMLRNSDMRYLLLAVVGTVSIFLSGLLSIAGAFILARRYPWAAAAGLLWIVYFVLVTGPVTGAKYRLPIEPVLIPLSAIGLVWLWESLRRARKVRK